MWLSTGEFGADLSKTFSKKVLEIVLEEEILAPLWVLDFRKDRTPKTLDNQVESICKLACKDTHADCSASLCRRQRSAKRHLEKGDARKEYTSGFSAFSIVFYFRLFCGNVGFRGKSWKPFAQKARGFAYRRHRALYEVQSTRGICVARRWELKFVPEECAFRKFRPEQHIPLLSQNN